jgi:hypothetical protein
MMLKSNRKQWIFIDAEKNVADGGLPETGHSRAAQKHESGKAQTKRRVL